MFETSFLYGCIKILFILLPVASEGNCRGSTENKCKIVNNVKIDKLSIYHVCENMTGCRGIFEMQ